MSALPPPGYVDSGLTIYDVPTCSGEPCSSHEGRPIYRNEHGVFVAPRQEDTMPPTMTKKDDLVGKQVRSKASGITGHVVERIDHEPQYRIQWTDGNGDKAEALLEGSDLEAV